MPNWKSIDPNRVVDLGLWYAGSTKAHNRLRDWTHLRAMVDKDPSLEFTYGAVRDALQPLYGGDRVKAGGARSNLLHYGCITLI